MTSSDTLGGTGTFEPLAPMTESLRAKLHVLTSGERFVFRGATIIDGTSGPPVPDGELATDGEHVVYAGPRRPALDLDGWTVIDLAGKFLLPGLMDCHVHLTGSTTFDPYRRYLEPRQELRLFRAAADAAALLEAGFTTLRHVGGWCGPILKRAINGGLVIGPRVLASGPELTPSGGHGDWTVFPYDWVKSTRFRGWIVDGVDECRAAVRRQLRDGADLIKVMAGGGGITNTPEDLAAMDEPQFSADELAAIVETAHARRARVVAHTSGPRSTQQSVDTGIDSIEHGSIPSDQYHLLDAMAERGAVLDPTLSMAYRTATEGERWGIFAQGREAAKRYLELRMRMVVEARRRGVTVIAGTDTDGLLGRGESALELKLLADAGLPAMEVLCSATQHAAVALGVGQEVGTLKAGKLAEFLVVGADPLRDIAVLLDTRNIERVYKTSVPLAVTR